MTSAPRDEQLTNGNERLAAGTGTFGDHVGEGVRAGAADVGTDPPVIGAVAECSRQTNPRLWRHYLTILLDGLRPRRDGPTPLPQPALDEAALDETMRTWRPNCR